MTRWLAILISVLAIGPAAAQRLPLVPPQTVGGMEFTIRSANMAMISPGAANSPLPTARFSIAITNRGKSSIGLLIDAPSSGASTDTGLDLKRFAGHISRGLQACEGGCRNIAETSWIILQPGQTDNVLIPFIASVPSAEAHRRAETMDLTLVLLVKESGGGVTRLPLSWADIPFVNEVK